MAVLMRELDRLLESRRDEELFSTAGLSGRRKTPGLPESLPTPSIAAATSDIPRRSSMLLDVLQEVWAARMFSDVSAGGGVSATDGVLE
jgi:hypothetical protein